MFHPSRRHRSVCTCCPCSVNRCSCAQMQCSLDARNSSFYFGMDREFMARIPSSPSAPSSGPGFVASLYSRFAVGVMHSLSLWNADLPHCKCHSSPLASPSPQSSVSLSSAHTGVSCVLPFELHVATLAPCHDSQCIHEGHPLACVGSGRHPCGQQQSSCPGFPLPWAPCLKTRALVGWPLGQGHTGEPCR